jgi:hypothetical protein
MTLAELRALAVLNDNGYRRFPSPYHQMSVTLEEADLLYALVRALRPRNVLELGSGLGLSGFFIASALKANGDEGTLMSIEPNKELAEQAIGLLTGLPVTVAEPFGVRSDWPALVYIDSRESDRLQDMRTWLTNGYTGLVLVHDAERQYPELAQGIFGYGVYLPTANGMWIGRGK